MTQDTTEATKADILKVAHERIELVLAALNMDDGNSDSIGPNPMNLFGDIDSQPVSNSPSLKAMLQVTS